MINRITISAATLSIIMMMASVGLVSDGFDVFIANLTTSSIFGGGITIIGYRIYSYIFNLKLERDDKQTDIDLKRAEIESIRTMAALPRRYIPGVASVTPTPTPPHPPEEQAGNRISFPVYKDGILSSSPHGKDAWERAAVYNLHHAGLSTSAIAKEVYGNKGGYQNQRVKDILENI